MREAVEFLTLRENWGLFRLPNGILLKARPTLTFLYSDKDHPEQLTFRAQHPMAVDAPARFQERKAKRQKPVGPRRVLQLFSAFEILRQPESLYQLPNQTLLQLQMTITEVKLTDHFDREGQPILEVSYNTVLLASSPQPAGLPTLPS